MSFSRIGGGGKALRGYINFMKILIIEDEANIAQVIRLYLEQANYTVLTASDGAAGLELHAREQPDLVILDLMLPVMDGMEVCRRIRAWADTPILMLTARQGEEDRIAGLEMGADDYLVKPFSPREVVSRVKAILRRTSRTGALPSREAEPQAEVVGAHQASQFGIPKANHTTDSGASDKAKEETPLRNSTMVVYMSIYLQGESKLMGSM